MNSYTTYDLNVCYHSDYLFGLSDTMSFGVDSFTNTSVTPIKPEMYFFQKYSRLTDVDIISNFVMFYLLFVLFLVMYFMNMDELVKKYSTMNSYTNLKIYSLEKQLTQLKFEQAKQTESINDIYRNCKKNKKLTKETMRYITHLYSYYMSLNSCVETLSNQNSIHHHHHSPTHYHSSHLPQQTSMDV
jgi:hypothetical protein